MANNPLPYPSDQAGSRPLSNSRTSDVRVADLKPNPGNPRTHSPKQIRQIADSIQRFGWTSPILIDEAGMAIAGAGRVAAAKLLGREMVSAISIAGWSEAEIRAYVIADNRIAENAGWDRQMLAIEFQYLIDCDFDLTLTGFETVEIDLIIGEADTNPLDEVPAIAPDAGTVTRPGDLWHIGKHRLLCGDATNPEDYDRLMGGELAQAVITDPPYNVPIAGHVGGLGKIQHREFAKASGEMSPAEYTAFLRSVFEALVRFSQPGSLHYVFTDWRHITEMITAGSVSYGDHKNLIVWTKTNAGMGSLYRSQHELIFLFKNGTAPHINNIELGKHGRYRTNVWSYPGANGFREGRDEDLAAHPTVKPVALIADAILDCSKQGGIVLDPFCGSGTLLLGAEKTHRRGYGMEIDPRYVDVAIERMQKTFKTTAVHVETGLTFDETRAQRESKEDVT